jgi:endonuclease/exonuclease/phosphatase (EEP) superfamily protein YafD
MSEAEPGELAPDPRAAAAEPIESVLTDDAPAPDDATAPSAADTERVAPVDGGAAVEATAAEAPAPLHGRPAGDTPAVEEPRRKRSWRKHPLARVLSALIWIGLALLVTFEFLRRSGRTHPAELLFLFGLTPLLLVPAIFAVVVAAILRRWVLLAASVVVLGLFVFAVAPAVFGGGTPAWAKSSPQISVLFGNLRDNGPDDGKLKAVADADADVAVLVELTPDEMKTILADGGAAKWPYRIDASNWGTSGFGILSRIPLDPTPKPMIHSTLIGSSLKVGDATLHLFGEHTTSPTDAGRASAWASELDKLDTALHATQGPILLVGDFNATRWHEQFAHFLNEGYTDAHEAMGQGLSRSWPVTGRRLAKFGPLLRLDHALVNNDVGVVSVHDVDLPGSDHKGFIVRIAVRQ